VVPAGLHPDEAPTFKHPQGALDGALPQAHTLVQALAFPGLETVCHLGEGNRVGLPAEAQGAPDKVEKHLDLSAGQLRELAVEKHVGHARKPAVEACGAVGPAGVPTTSVRGCALFHVPYYGTTTGRKAMVQFSPIFPPFPPE